MNIVEIKDLSFKYAADKNRAGFALSVPALALASGSSLALFGASGAGKSTLLAICASLQKGFAGSVKLFGTPLNNYKRGTDAEAVSRMAILFQDAPLFNCGVYENISIGLQIRKTPRAEIKKRVDEMIEKLNISGIAYADAREISGGQAKRVCLARLLVLKPELLFLDEPFYSLDAINRSQIMHELKRLSAEAGIALMLVTHDKNEALALCENLAVMDAGSIIRYGDIKSCFNNPMSETEA
ncbi:MAG TPA: ATP-binding cassette domain-containing protein, partial [Candidatus Wallbacteria bacterium]|nr:ATP-binding cassette domain-containing protein [Candidatus Wallbacteria bacterium]